MQSFGGITFLLLHYETGSCLVSKQSFNALATKTPSHKVSQMLSCRYGFAALPTRPCSAEAATRRRGSQASEIYTLRPLREMYSKCNA